MDKQELKDRINNALILLKDRHPIRVGDLTLHSKNKLSLKVIGWINNNYLENITKQSALKELNEIKDLFSKMVDISNELSDFIQNKKVEYCLDLDYGKGGIGICKEKDGQIIWETDLSD